MASFSVARGSYIKMKAVSGKDKNTIYFGYDTDILKGIFIGDNELTTSIKNITLTKNVDDEKFIDLSLYIYEDGLIIRNVCKIFNSNLLSKMLSDMTDLISLANKDIIDISTRLGSLENNVKTKFIKIDTSINYILSHNTSGQNINWIDLD